MFPPFFQKVDLYSLGIIFFEMCYPLLTGMERVNILVNLRNSEIILPTDFTEDERPQHVHIIRYVLWPLNALDILSSWKSSVCDLLLTDINFTFEFISFGWAPYTVQPL